VKVGTDARERGADSLGAAVRPELAAVLAGLVGAELAVDADVEGAAVGNAGGPGHDGEAAGIRDGHAEGLRVFVNEAEFAVELGLRGTRHAVILASPDKIRRAARHALDLQTRSRRISDHGGMVARHDPVNEGHVLPSGGAGGNHAVTGEIDVADSDLVVGGGIEGPVATASEEDVRRGGRQDQCRQQGGHEGG